jgi:hypothetical protein
MSKIWTKVIKVNKQKPTATTVTRQRKSRNFRDNYLCDFHLRAFGRDNFMLLSRWKAS